MVVISRSSVCALACLILSLLNLLSLSSLFTLHALSHSIISLHSASNASTTWGVLPERAWSNGASSAERSRRPIAMRLHHIPCLKVPHPSPPLSCLVFYKALVPPHTREYCASSDPPSHVTNTHTHTNTHHVTPSNE